jgi:predicted ATPase
MNSTATGIKMFGFLQILLLNETIQKNTVLILDEPEVHLHPKWQLKYAQIIVELVSSGVKVLITSHSPYMIEALQRYSELEKINSDFYLAEDGYIKKENDSNSETLAKIYEKLSQPYDTFEKMEQERFMHGRN